MRFLRALQGMCRGILIAGVFLLVGGDEVEASKKKSVSICEWVKKFERSLQNPRLSKVEIYRLKKQIGVIRSYCAKKAADKSLSLCQYSILFWKKAREAQEPKLGLSYKAKGDVFALLCRMRKGFGDKFAMTFYWLGLWMKGLPSLSLVRCLDKGLKRLSNERRQPKLLAKGQSIPWFEKFGALDSLCLLRSDNMSERLYALNSLSYSEPIAPEVIPAVMKQVKASEEKVRYKAIEVLSGWSWKKGVGSCLPALVFALKDKSWKVRANAARTIGKFPTESKAGVSALTGVLRDKKWNVRAGAIRALGALGVRAVDATPDLIEMLKDEKLLVRANAVEALGKIAPRSKVAVPFLITHTLKTEKPRIRRLAMRSLSRFGKDAFPALPALERALQDPLVRSSALNAMRIILKKPHLRAIKLKKRSVLLRKDPSLESDGKHRAKIGEVGLLLSKVSLSNKLYYTKVLLRVHCHNNRFYNIPKDRPVYYMGRGRYWARTGRCEFHDISSQVRQSVRRVNFFYLLRFPGNRIGWAVDHWF